MALCWTHQQSCWQQVSALVPNNSSYQNYRSPCTKTSSFSSSHLHASSTADSDEGTRLERRLLDDFRIHTGEVVDPYRVLGISRSADRTEIKLAYRTLSRRYHPDGILQRNDGILPGRWYVGRKRKSGYMGNADRQACHNLSLCFLMIYDTHFC